MQSHFHPIFRGDRWVGADILCTQGIEIVKADEE